MPLTVLGHVTTLTLRSSASPSALLAVPALRGLSCITMSVFSHPSALVRYDNTERNCIVANIFLSSSDANPCNGFECGEGSECQIFEPTGEAFCNPNCEELNPCGPQQVCTLQPVNCVRAPCPPVLLCEDSELKD